MPTRDAQPHPAGSAVSRNSPRGCHFRKRQSASTSKPRICPPARPPPTHNGSSGGTKLTFNQTSIVPTAIILVLGIFLFWYGGWILNMTWQLWSWIGFHLFGLLMLALDRGGFHRKSRAVSFREAVAWTVTWITRVNLVKHL